MAVVSKFDHVAASFFFFLISTWQQLGYILCQQVKVKAAAHLWCCGHSTSISICWVWRVRVEVKVSKREFHIHIHLD